MMVEYQSPGIYFERAPVEEAIIPVATATAGFVGYAPESASAPVHTPVLVTSWNDFCDLFGDVDRNAAVSGCYLAHAVHGFFVNGGERAFVVRVPVPAQFRSALETDSLALRECDIQELAGTLPTEGREKKRYGVAALMPVDEVALIAVPDLMAGLWRRDRLWPTRAGRCPYCAGRLPGPAKHCYSCRRPGPESVREAERDTRQLWLREAQRAMVEHCDGTARDRIAVLDPLPGLAPHEQERWITSSGYACERGHAAFYYPWLQAQDGFRGEDRMVPPSGHLAGVWARNDASRGVHHAPANLPIEGALDTERALTEGEQHRLNPRGINCIRTFPGRGVYVWGARTLATHPDWKYLNVRRLLTFIEQSIERNTQWVVFEPNNPMLWERLTAFLNSFLTNLWREGKLAGGTPEEAFRVRCDEETNPEEIVALGQIVTEVSVAPLKPAEYVVIRVQHAYGAP